MGKKIAKKANINEQIQVGDLLMYDRMADNVTRARYKKIDVIDSNCVIGVCVDVNDSYVTYINNGIAKVNVLGLVCLGDKLTISEDPGKAVALKYEQNITQFGKRCIGKVIELYNDYSIANVMLDIE